MAKIDLDAMSIDELVTLRDNASAKLVEKVAARQLELEAEIERLAQLGKSGKKTLAAPPVTKPKKGEKKGEEKAEEKVEEPSAPSEPSVAEAA